jgi:hypothetical protein
MRQIAQPYPPESCPRLPFRLGLQPRGAASTVRPCPSAAVENEASVMPFPFAFTLPATPTKWQFHTHAIPVHFTFPILPFRSPGPLARSLIPPDIESRCFLGVMRIPKRQGAGRHGWAPAYVKYDVSRLRISPLAATQQTSGKAGRRAGAGLRGSLVVTN